MSCCVFISIFLTSSRIFVGYLGHTSSIWNKTKLKKKKDFLYKNLKKDLSDLLFRQGGFCKSFRNLLIEEVQKSNLS